MEFWTVYREIQILWVFRLALLSMLCKCRSTNSHIQPFSCFISSATKCLDQNMLNCQLSISVCWKEQWQCLQFKMDGSLVVHRRRKNFQSFCTNGVWQELLTKGRINAIRKKKKKVRFEGAFQCIKLLLLKHVAKMHKAVS